MGKFVTMIVVQWVQKGGYSRISRRQSGVRRGWHGELHTFTPVSFPVLAGGMVW